MQFVPMLPQPPELACVLRRVSFILGTFAYSILDCRNGGVLVGGFVSGVHSPLHPERGIVVVPSAPDDTLEDDTCYSFGQLLSKDGSDGVVYLFLSMEFNQQAKATAHVYMLQDGGWHIHASATIQFHVR
ncbi:hypothetical protein E2562_010315 [Oryza meyeriana var. granulata]|uniref:F-box protein AT5G49610-like beta-propeller domain-containing protein n=1 Tax=Oryza meyeriana var. granulata TaxID=110450 RepID=A0A6G1F681_9ORYZ|nr:hypothetical protein E2562_010315 [Oryza meyeriana var. granulata]